MEERRRRERRTGVIFLVLVAATNVVVWMEPVASARVAGEPAAASEIRVALSSCALAVGLVLASWVFGRRAAWPGISTARRLGLQLSLACAVLNLALVGALLLLARPFAVPISDISLIAIAWYLVLLPLQLAAAYTMGRGSSGEGRRDPASDTPSAQRTER